MAQDGFTDPRNRSPLRKKMDDAVITGAGAIANAVSPVNTADQSGAQQPGESLEAFRTRTQAAVDTGTYVPPTRSAFGAGAANTSIDIARKIGGALFPSSETAAAPKPIEGVGVKQPEAPKPVNSMPSFATGVDENQPFPGGQQTTPGPGAGGETPWYKKNGWGIVDTPTGPNAVRVTKGVSPTTGGELTNIEARGNIPGLQKTEDPVSKVMREVDELVENVTSGKYKTMPRSTFGQLVELRKSQLTAQLGLEGHRQSAKDRDAVAREKIAETKRFNDIRAEDKDREQALRSSEAFGKHMELTSPTVGTDDTGKPIKARDIGLLDIMDSGEKFRAKAPELYPAAQQLWDRRELAIRDAIIAKGGEYKAEDVNKPGTKTYASREVARKRYRDALLQKYGTAK